MDFALRVDAIVNGCPAPRNRPRLAVQKSHSMTRLPLPPLELWLQPFPFYHLRLRQTLPN
jgi:hypothetical protein